MLKARLQIHLTSGRETSRYINYCSGAKASLGHPVSAASSGRESLFIAEGSREKIDLLITDVLMPEMNGREVADALRAHDAGLKVLFLSGQNGYILVRDKVTPDGAAFLQKPFTLDALYKKLKEVLDQR